MKKAITGVFIITLVIISFLVGYPRREREYNYPVDKLHFCLFEMADRKADRELSEIADRSNVFKTVYKNIDGFDYPIKRGAFSQKTVQVFIHRIATEVIRNELLPAGFESTLRYIQREDPCRSVAVLRFALNNSEFELYSEKSRSLFWIRHADVNPGMNEGQILEKIKMFLNIPRDLKYKITHYPDSLPFLHFSTNDWGWHSNLLVSVEKSELKIAFMNWMEGNAASPPNGGQPFF